MYSGPLFFGSGISRDSGSLSATQAHRSDGIEDDDDDDENDDDASSLFIDETQDDSSASRPSTQTAISPSPAISQFWSNVLGFPKVLPSSGRAAFGPQSKKIIKKWADQDKAPLFAAPRREDCLHASFESVSRKHPEFWKLAQHASAASGAAAHAILSAANALDGFFAEFKSAIGDDVQWSAWLLSAQDKAKSSFVSPLHDAVRCCASVFGQSTSLVRQAVVKEADKSIQSILETKPPANGFFFGDPSEALQSRMQYEFMASALKPKSSSFNKPRSAVASRPAAAPYRKPQPSSAKPAGNASGRSFRGGKGGRKPQ